MSDSRNHSEQEERDTRDMSATAGDRQGGDRQDHRGGEQQGGEPTSRPTEEEGGENRSSDTGKTGKGGNAGDTGKTTMGYIGPDLSTYEETDRKELIATLAERDRYIQEMEQELKNLKESNLRKTAEMDNFRKRVQRDRAQIYESAKANALEDFLSVNDDLRRTLKAAADLEVPDTFMDGITLVADKFEEVLKKQGVERIDEELVPFDVDLHDAMMRRKPEDEDVESDMVLQVVESGYRIGDRTIRHAKVIVSE